MNCINCQSRNRHDDLLYCQSCMAELFCSKCKTNLRGKQPKCKDCEKICFAEGCKNKMIDNGTLYQLLKDNQRTSSIRNDEHYCKTHNETMEAVCGHKIIKGEAERCYDHCIQCVSK